MIKNRTRVPDRLIKAPVKRGDKNMDIVRDRQRVELVYNCIRIICYGISPVIGFCVGYYLL